MRRAFALYGAGDPAIVTTAHPDLTVTPLAPNLLTRDRTYRGLEEVAEWALGLQQADFKVVPTDIRDIGGGNVLVLGTISVAHPGRPGAAARGAWLVHVRDGLITSVEAHHSEEEALANVEE
ncbi:MAG: nuclear transport factor 2 family protein [Thermoleophilaceae bacterium]|nr:nuclear transport factor 2 family protein [Thermoleophilaceae bacterium]